MCYITIPYLYQNIEMKYYYKVMYNHKYEGLSYEITELWLVLHLMTTEIT